MKWKDWIETLQMAATVTGIIVLFIISIVGIDYNKCKTKAELQEMEYNYSVMGGCMVKIDGKWIDYNRLRYND